eukprot:UN14124
MLQAVNHHIVRTVVTGPASSKFCSKRSSLSRRCLWINTSCLKQNHFIYTRLSTVY